MAGVGTALAVAGSIASLLAFYAVIFELGRRTGRKQAGAGSPTEHAPIDAFVRFRRSVDSAEPTDIDVVGYSVHAITAEITPQIRRSLAAGRTVRILILDPASESIFEKTELEHSTARLPVPTFLGRTQRNIDHVAQELRELSKAVMYQENVGNVDLRIRLYDSLPIYRGARAGGTLVMASYLDDLGKPARTFPHVVAASKKSPVEPRSNARFTEWFDYLWAFRSHPHGKRAILVDLYDTLVRIRPDVREDMQRRMADRLGVAPDALIEEWQKTTRDSNLGLLVDTTTRFAKILQRLGVDRAADPAELAAMEHQLLVREQELAPGVDSFLRQARRRGYRIGLVSNCSASVNWTLHASGLRRLFDTEALSYQVGSVKPDPAIFHQALADLGCAAEEAYFVGDGNNDELSAAAGLSITPIQITWANARRHHGAGDGWSRVGSFRHLAELIDPEARWVFD